MTPDEARRVVAERCRVQAGWCERLGSPLYAELLRRAAEDVDAEGPVWPALRGTEARPEEDYAALRLMGSVHRLVLEGRAPELATHYPSVGGRPGTRVWQAFQAAVRDHPEEIRALLEVPPQTNEVGRSASLLGGFLLLAGATGLPLRLLEVGASAGLNLRWDRYHYRSGGWSWGDAASPVTLDHVFGEGPTPPGVEVTVAEREGCDLDPIDPVSEEGRLTLLSYVWPDQVERIERLRAALRIAEEVPAPVERASAAPWLERKLTVPSPGTTTVVFHSVVLGYLDDAQRRRVVAVLEEAGGRATDEAPLGWLSLERVEHRFEVRLRTWPGDQDRLLARSHPHGPPVEWLAGEGGRVRQ